MNKRIAAVVFMGLSICLSSESYCVMRAVNMNFERVGGIVLNAEEGIMIAERAVVSVKEFRNESGGFVSFARMKASNGTKFVFADTIYITIESGPKDVSIKEIDGPCTVQFSGEDGFSDGIGLSVDGKARTVRLNLSAATGDVEVFIPYTCKGEINVVKSYTKYKINEEDDLPAEEGVSVGSSSRSMAEMD